MSQIRSRPLTLGLLGLAALSSQALGRQLQTTIDPNCHVWDYETNFCTQCAFRYYHDTATGLCHMVDDQCKDWSTISGDCTDCYEGYHLQDG
jgi:hypothetical protein